MKKILSVLLIIVMVTSCIAMFSGCSDEGVEYLSNPELPEDVTDGFGYTNEFAEKPAPATKPDKTTDITFLLDWAPNTNHTGLYVALENGYYEEEGLNVNIIQPDTTGTSGSVAAGNAQFGIDFQEQMIFHEQNDVNVTAIAAVIQHNTSGIVSKKALGIKTPADMINHKYATWGIPGEQAVIYNMLKNANVKPEKLKMIPNTVMNIVGEFSNPNGVDCVWSYAAWDKIFLDNAKIETNFIWMKDYGLDYYTPVIVANNKFKNENPEKVEAFLRATKKGYEYAIQNPHEAGDILIKRNPELEPSKDIIYASQDFLAKEYQSDAPYWGYIDGSRWDGFFDLVCGSKK